MPRPPSESDPSPADAPPLGDATRMPVEHIVAAWRRERPGTPTESIPVVTLLWRLAKLFADDRRRVLTAAGVDAATLDLLSTLRRAGSPYSLTTRELADRCLVTAGAISQRVARAERDGLVTRSPAAGRAVAVGLTPAGHDLVEDTVDRVLRREAHLVAGLPDQHRDRLAEDLAELYADLRHRLAEDPPAATRPEPDTAA